MKPLIYFFFFFRFCFFFFQFGFVWYLDTIRTALHVWISRRRGLVTGEGIISAYLFLCSLFFFRPSPSLSPFLPRSAFHIIISYFLAKDRNPFVFSIQIGE